MAIAELFNMVKLCSDASKKLNVDPHDVRAVQSLFTKAKSISAQASKYVMEYPVACSTTITDYKTALAITKQVEFDCARFIILASGLNPVIRQQDGDSIHAHINSLVSSYESLSGFKVSITPATQEMIDSCEGYVLNEMSNEIYQIYNPDTETTKLAFSREAPNNNGPMDFNPLRDNYNDTSVIIQKDANGKDIYPDPNDINANAGRNGRYDISRKEINRAAMKNHVALDEINNKLGKCAPTIVNIKMYVQAGDGSDRQVDFPLAVKATLQYVDAIDINEMLSQVDSKAKKLFKLIQLTSGEIKFFKDFLFALDSVKSDVDRERVVGNTPFFRRLMSNKSKYRFKTVANFIPFIKDFVASKKQSDMPMCTIIIDESELRGLKLRLSDCLKNRQKYIDPMLDTYMLLGLGIVDSDNGVIHFFYSGEDYPVTCDIDKVGSNSKDKDISSDLSKALANMSRLVTKH